MTTDKTSITVDTSDLEKLPHDEGLALRENFNVSIPLACGQDRKTNFTTAVLLSMPPDSRFTSIEDVSSLLDEPSPPSKALRVKIRNRGYAKPTPWPLK